MGIAGWKVSVRNRKKIKENEKNRKYEATVTEQKQRTRKKKKAPIAYWWIKGKMKTKKETE